MAEADSLVEARKGLGPLAELQRIEGGVNFLEGVENGVERLEDEGNESLNW